MILDIGKMDEEGYIALVGRKKEVIKVSGFSVFPAEIEDIFCKHPAVMEACVVGVTDETRGQIPKVFLVLKSEYKGKITTDDIMMWAKENISAYKRPRIIEFRDFLPKSAAGKILRRVLIEESSREIQKNKRRIKMRNSSNFFMRKKVYFYMLSMMFVFFYLIINPQPGITQTIELKFSHWIPPSSIYH